MTGTNRVRSVRIVVLAALGVAVAASMAVGPFNRSAAIAGILVVTGLSSAAADALRERASRHAVLARHVSVALQWLGVAAFLYLFYTWTGRK